MKPVESSPQFEENDTIFVSVANYRDSEGPLTLLDLFAKAYKPSRVFVGYVLQADENHDKACFISSDFTQKAESEHRGSSQWLKYNVRLSLHGLQDSSGPCWARCQAQKLWMGERYFLQIDSHMRFRPNWDSYLISLLESIRLIECTKPVLTTYPVAYKYPNEVPMQPNPTVLVSFLTNVSRFSVDLLLCMFAAADSLAF
jgi:[Skp1-protein]-hydroxyproline N-acetylglucosaminyltransferase